jgi:hypothetical protein
MILDNFWLALLGKFEIITVATILYFNALQLIEIEDGDLD